MERIYFDNNATTPLDPAVREAMLPYLNDELFGNPSSGHWFGEQALAGINKAREQVAGLLNCPPKRIFFTSGGTEANNTAIWSAVSAFPERKHIISSVVEHASILQPLEFLQQRFGYTIELLPVGRDGSLDLQQLAEGIRSDTALVTLMGANNESGVIFPIEEIGAICGDKKTLFLCDAVQLVGKEPVNLENLNIDYLAVAAHKLHGPKGSGALYVRRTAPFIKMIMGAGQEMDHRAGTENVSGIVGLGQACELAGKHLAKGNSEIRSLRDTMQERILQEIDEAIVNGAGQPRLPNTLNVSFKNCASGAMVQELDERGVAVSAHSACHSGDLDPSHVLRAMAVPETHIHGTLRISLSRFNTSREVAVFCDMLPGIVAKSRQGVAV
ncbi:MAG: aminotransferase class V-fold PLP-dependent enzyme [Deltaproteobacteria bacterium]|jgi:cysteine desulfurase|nr:aminotransferase class V-fold PLP-dependent enzyme [Deltaproteobacteria bacterium]